jgi:transcriptional regulator with XRE-family HTH domain
MNQLSQNLAANLRRLRENLGLSQQQVANNAGVPRPTWANLESGEANPTISVLTKVAAALNVDVESLVRPPVAAVRVVTAESLPSRRRGRVSVRSLLPEPLVGLELERLVLPPTTQLHVGPHARGSKKYVTCEVGEIELIVMGTAHFGRAGDVQLCRGDQAHTFRNVGHSAAVVYCVVSFAGND